MKTTNPASRTSSCSSSHDIESSFRQNKRIDQAEGSGSSKDFLRERKGERKFWREKEIVNFRERRLSCDFGKQVSSEIYRVGSSRSSFVSAELHRHFKRGWARGEHFLWKLDTWIAFFFVIWNVHEGILATRRLRMLRDQNLIKTLEGVEVIYR